MTNPRQYGEQKKLEDEFQRLIQVCADNVIILVTAAGNLGKWPMRFPSEARGCLFTGDMMPMRYASPDNEVIGVGGATEDGQLWTDSSPRGFSKVLSDRSVVAIQDPNNPRLGPDDLLGSVDIYARALQVDTMGIGGIQTKRDGTSYSAPQVVGRTLDPACEWSDVANELYLGWPDCIPADEARPSPRLGLGRTEKQGQALGQAHEGGAAGASMATRKGRGRDPIQSQALSLWNSLGQLCVQWHIWPTEG